MERGERVICIDEECLPQELPVSEEGIANLFQAGLVRRRPQRPRPKTRVDFEALNKTYREMLESGGFSNQTELARHLGVSRVLKGIKRE